MFGEPAPETFHSLWGLPGRQFSFSIAFYGAGHAPNTEKARLKFANARSRSLTSAGLIQANVIGQQDSVSPRRGSSYARSWVEVMVLLPKKGMFACDLPLLWLSFCSSR